jgi:hypothetical protein
MIPEAALVRIFQAWARTAHFDAVAAQHSLNAREEMTALASQLIDQARLSGLATPALKALCERQTCGRLDNPVQHVEGCRNQHV